MNQYIPRRYISIWNKIKLTGSCAIAAPPQLHLRIIKAVKKEKWMDAGYTYELAELSQHSKLHIRRQQGVIYFTLVKSIGLNDV